MRMAEFWFGVTAVLAVEFVAFIIFYLKNY